MWSLGGLGLLAAYVAYYLYLGFGLPLPMVVNGLLDDSFYYLQVARNVALGLGSTFDGIEPTNGYHPLWLWLLVPLYKLADSGVETALRASLGLSILLALGTLILLRRIHLRSSGTWAALAALLLFSWPRFFGQTLNLLETGLLLFLYLWIFSLLSVPAPSTPARFGALGVLLGLACLARLDTVFLWGSIALFGTVAGVQGRSLHSDLTRQAWTRNPGGPGITHFGSERWGTARSPVAGRASLVPALRQIVSNLSPLLVAAALLAPYLIWNWTRFGHPQPISGAMKSSFPHPRPRLDYLGEYPEFTAILGLGICFAVVGLKRNATPFLRALGIFGTAAVLHILYTVLFMTWGVDRWHYALVIPIGLIGIPWLLDQALQRIRLETLLRSMLLVLGLAGAVAVQTLSLGLRRDRHLETTRQMALWAASNLPPDSRVATTDAGVFAYFSGFRTINLDGLINNYRYRDMLRAGRLREYLHQREVGFILDQYAVGRPDWVSGNYYSRRYPIWYHPEGRVAAELTLYREDEVQRIPVLSRPFPGSPRLEPNAVVLWKYRPE